MNLSLFRAQRAWVSLPIIALLLAMSSLSMHFQERLMASYKWHGQVNEVEADQQIWTDFRQALVMTPGFTLAKASECIGFCDLDERSQEKTWRKDNQLVRYRWESYESLPDEFDNAKISYRLCATQNQQQYLCWWWREDRLLASGWVSASD
ncbi:hypothetical protein EBI01_19805 [Marinomonas rhizomae]|uniref:Uncharacterized protein n=1 Tax=Marinomonas rhizomae TaxID=491948 RepID=A0A366IT14_9GAMM|nr:hypothetical protein [Marinomonas rhizomae]RBP77922.1 hypothetical protein DFP80_12413 [Marinomonas rhizomae]RNF68901.1 hypothetical protein EBI01_19805 [Marinomonas rhizomae]